MLRIHSFIWGFVLSFISVFTVGYLHNSNKQIIHTKQPSSSINIDLFRNKDTVISFQNSTFSEIKRESTDVSNTPVDVAENPSYLPEFQANADIFSKDEEEQIAYSPDGIDDDEIIPISISDLSLDDISKEQPINAEFIQDENSDKVAMLPDDFSKADDVSSRESSPWTFVNAPKHIKNKKMVEQFTEASADKLPLNNFKQAVVENNEVSYKVAERIKQSIIFPIPEDILNDENLTPTFVKKTKNTVMPPSPKPLLKKSNNTNIAKDDTSIKKEISEDKKSKPRAVSFVSKATPKTENEDLSLLDSLSSWFSDKASDKIPQKKPTKTEQVYKPKHKKTAPSYSSGEGTLIKPEDNLAVFYEKMQETKNEYIRNNIIPTELKLSFQPNRAEISGQTLKWIKTFSEATYNYNTYLQIRLDASASVELQKRRLNLLYTIFVKNGVDLNKIDTVFSKTEPDTFIIRVLTNNNEQKGF